MVLEVEREIIREGDELMMKKKKENDKGVNVWKNQLKGKSKRKGKERGALIEKASICLCEIGSLGLVGLLVVVLVVALRWWPPSPFWLCQ